MRRVNPRTLTAPGRHRAFDRRCSGARHLDITPGHLLLAAGRIPWSPRSREATRSRDPRRDTGNGGRVRSKSYGSRRDDGGGHPAADAGLRGRHRGPSQAVETSNQTRARRLLQICPSSAHLNFPVPGVMERFCAWLATDVRKCAPPIALPRAALNGIAPRRSAVCRASPAAARRRVAFRRVRCPWPSRGWALRMTAQTASLGCVVQCVGRAAAGALGMGLLARC